MWLLLRIDFFNILSDVVRLVTVGEDAMQSYIAMLASFGMASRHVTRPCDDLSHNCELGLKQHMDCKNQLHSDMYGDM